MGLLTGWRDCSFPAPPHQAQLYSQDSGSLSSNRGQLNASVSCSRPCDSKTTPFDCRHNNNNKGCAIREARTNPAANWQADSWLFHLHLHDFYRNLPCCTRLCILTTSSLASWRCPSFPTSLAVARSSCTSPIVPLVPFPSVPSSTRQILILHLWLITSCTGAITMPLSFATPLRAASSSTVA